jgi:hypothetical protein
MFRKNMTCDYTVKIVEQRVPLVAFFAKSGNSWDLGSPVSGPVTPLDRMAGTTRLELATSAVTA